MADLTAEWCRWQADQMRYCNYFIPERNADIAAALRIAAAVLDEGSVEQVARRIYETQCAVMGEEPNWGRSTPEQPSGFKTEAAVHLAAAQAVLSYLREAQT